MLKTYKEPALTDIMQTIEYYRLFIASHKFWTLTKINVKLGAQEEQKQEIDAGKHIKKLKQQKKPLFKS